MKRSLVPLGVVLALSTLVLSSRMPAPAQGAPQAPLRFDVAADFGRMPLVFIPGADERGGAATYAVRGRDRSIAFAPAGLTFVLSGARLPDAERTAGERWVVKLDFLGADLTAGPRAAEQSGTTVSYFRGTPGRWRTDIPACSRIAYAGLWPGIDLVFSGTRDRLKYELVVHPGADPSRIRMAYRGASGVEAGPDGSLEVRTPLGSFVDGKPAAYQDVEGRRVAVDAAYDLDQAKAGEEGSRALGFRLEGYDRAQTLVIDPFIEVYGGFIGGSGYDVATAIAVDSAGCAYVVGSTTSSEATFPVTVGPDPTYNGGGADTDAFVAKVAADGSGLVYCGYIGGAGNDVALGVAVDPSGNAYVTGMTASSEATFPIAAGPGLTYKGGTAVTMPDGTVLLGDAFVAKVNPGGTSLSYCGYIGGTATEAARGIAVNAGGEAFVTGVTQSSDLPTTVGPDTSFHGIADAFVAKVNPGGTSLSYCGYIGGSNGDTWGMGIALDGSDNAFVTGFTRATETGSFPVNVGPDVTQNGSYDAFVARVDAGGSLVACGYIGGSGDDKAYGVALDGAGCVYVTGSTTSSAATFPKTVGPSLVYGGGQDAFVAKVNAAGTDLDYCGYIGGSGNETGAAISVTNIGGKPTAFLAGGTNSSPGEGFPVVYGPWPLYGGNGDAFLARVGTNGDHLVYCGYLGSDGTEDGFGLVANGQGTVYVCGRTDSSTGVPTVVGPSLAQSGGYDAFVAKISCRLATPVLTDPPNGAQSVGVNGIDFRWTDPNDAPQEGGYKMRLKYAGQSYTEYSGLPQDTTSQTVGSSEQPFAKNQILYWNVATVSSNPDDFPDPGWANGGADFVFRTEGGAAGLFPPALVSPASGSTGQPTSLTLSWLDPNSSPNETRYRVRVKPGGGSYTNYNVAANATSFFLTGRKANKTYYWNVQAVGNGTTVANSSWANGGVDWSFSTAGPVKLKAPVLVSPANGAAGQPQSVTLTWTDTNTTAQEAGYQVRIKVKGGAYAKFTTARDATTYLKSNLRRGKTYFWNVRAKGDGKGTLNSAWANGGVDFRFTT
jgi:hypothetical protein